MNRLLKAAAALVCAFGLQLAAPAQMTNITAAANSLSIGGSVISTGTVTIVPVNVNGIPIPIKKSGGGLVGPGPMHCSITSGVLGSCPVPDSSLTTPPNILYTITLKDTSTGNETSGLSFVEQAIAGISGATWGLDQYAPPAATTAYQGIAAAHGPSVPTSCSAPSYFTLDTSSTLEQCVGGVYVPVTGSSPLPATATTMGVVQLPNGQTSTQLSKVAVTGQTADLVGTLPHSLLPPLVSADIPSNAANTTGNAATATALAGTPGQCPAGQAPTGILSNGTATGCAPASGGGASTPATSALLKGNGNANGVSAATAGTDYPTVASVTSAASSASAAQTTANTAVTNAAAAQATANTAVTNAATANSAAAAAQTAANTAVTNAATAASAASAAQATANTASTNATAAQTAATSASTNASSAQTAASAASTAATAATAAAANAVQKTGDAMTGPLVLQSTATLQGTGPAEVGFGHASGPTIVIPGNAVTLMAPVTPPSGGAGIRLPVPDNTSGPLCMPALANDPENSAFQSSVFAHCTAGTDYATPASVTAVQVAAQAASLQKANNLSDLQSASSARTNLGLGSAATTSSSAYDAAGAAAAAQTAAQAASDPLGTAQALVANIQTTSTAVTANNMLYPDPANVGKFTTAALGKCGTGPAASSVASGASVQVYDNVKTWTLIADGAVTYGDFLIPGTTAGHVQDASALAGVTPNDRTTISMEQDICGKALATIASAGTLAVEPLGRGTRGLKVDLAPAIGAGVVWIAASDSAPAQKAIAGYVTTGTADQTVINAAIASSCGNSISTTAPSGCQISFFPGVYNLTGSIIIDQDNVRLFGYGHCQGPYLHSWQGTGSPAFGVGNGCVQIVSTTGGYNTFQINHANCPNYCNNQGDRSRHVGIEISGGFYVVGYNFTSAAVSSTAIDDFTRVADLVITQTLNCVNLAADGPIIENLNCEDVAGTGLILTGASGGTIVKNAMYDIGGPCGTFSATFGTVIQGNICGDAYGGFTVASGGSTVSGNIFEGVAGQFVNISGVRGVSVTGNAANNRDYTVGYTNLNLIPSTFTAMGCSGGATLATFSGNVFDTAVENDQPAVDLSGCTSSTATGNTFGGFWGLTGPVNSSGVGNNAAGNNAGISALSTLIAPVTSAGLDGRYAASTNSAVGNGNPVTSWADLSGWARTVTASTGTVSNYIASSNVNTRPGVRFTGGTASHFQNTAIHYPPGNNARSAFFVINPASLPAAGVNLLNGPSSSDNFNISGTAHPTIGNSGTNLSSTATLAAGSVYVIEFVANGTTSRISVNGSTLTTGTVGAATAITKQLYIGGGSGAFDFNGDLAELDTYYGAISTVDAQSVGAALCSAYGVTCGTSW